MYVIFDAKIYSNVKMLSLHNKDIKLAVYAIVYQTRQLHQYQRSGFNFLLYMYPATTGAGARAKRLCKCLNSLINSFIIFSTNGA